MCTPLPFFSRAFTSENFIADWMKRAVSPYPRLKKVCDPHTPPISPELRSPCQGYQGCTPLPGALPGDLGEGQIEPVVFCREILLPEKTDTVGGFNGGGCGSEYYRRLLVSAGNKLKETMGTFTVEGEIPHFINNEEWELVERLNSLFKFIIATCSLQSFNQV